MLRDAEEEAVDDVEEEPIDDVVNDKVEENFVEMIRDDHIEGDEVEMEVEANEKSECSPTVRHQGGEGGGLLLHLQLDLAASEHDPQARQLRGSLISERTV